MNSGHTSNLIPAASGSGNNPLGVLLPVDRKVIHSHSLNTFFMKNSNSNGHALVADPSVLSTQEFHLGGRKRLVDAVNDFQLTMQHALRANLTRDLEERAKLEAGVLPPLSASEMFDYLLDTDPDFLNWCFPYCAIVLTKRNISHHHAFILNTYRIAVDPKTKEKLEQDAHPPVADPEKGPDYVFNALNNAVGVKNDDHAEQ